MKEYTHVGFSSSKTYYRLDNKNGTERQSGTSGCIGTYRYAFGSVRMCSAWRRVQSKKARCIAQPRSNREPP